MHRRKHSALPAQLVRLEQRFARWRKNRSPGERIPESLWNAAEKAAADFGVSPTANALKVNYYALKKRLEHHTVDSTITQPAFIELPASPMAAPAECTIELEHHNGARMHVHLKGQNVPDLLALSRGFWDAH